MFIVYSAGKSKPFVEISVFDNFEVTTARINTSIHIDLELYKIEYRFLFRNFVITYILQNLAFLLRIIKILQYLKDLLASQIPILHAILVKAHQLQLCGIGICIFN